MEHTFEILPTQIMSEFKSSEMINPLSSLEPLKSNGLPDYEYAAAISAAYSASCERDEIDPQKFADWIKKGEEKAPEEYVDAFSLYKCYLHIRGKKLERTTANEVHSILAEPHLPKVYHGEIRTNPLFVVDRNDKIEYTACDVKKCEDELTKYYNDIEAIANETLNSTEQAYMATAMHLVFHKIQPYHNLNMPIARLIEKWYMMSVYGEELIALPMEKNYYEQEHIYQRARRKVGKDYYNLNYARSSSFFALAAEAY